MERIYLIRIFCLLLVSGNIVAQKNPESFRFFGVRGYSGELGLRAFYRDMDHKNENYADSQKSYYYSGGLMLNASTSILHPNFCQVELGAGHMPEAGRDNNLVSPDFSEVRTLKKLNILASFLNQKKITFITAANYDESYARRENLTDIKTTNKYLGGSVNYTNKFVPVTLDFYKRKLIQTEIQTGRILQIDQTNVEARAEQSFTGNDRQQFIYSHKFSSNLNEKRFYTANYFDEINFYSNIGLGAKKLFVFNTTLSDINQHGSYRYSRLHAMECLLIKLPANFVFITNYSYHLINQAFGKQTQHTSTNSLNHQLYKSLNSKLFFEYTTIKHPVFSEYNSKTGFEFNYSKHIPIGQLQLSYGYFRYHQEFTSDSVNLQVVNEDYVLSSSKIVLLKRPYINISSIVVKDVTGTITYQPGLDYMLIARDRNTEISRIPSGQIPDDGTVFLDYTARQPSSYKYDANNHMFSANLRLFKGKLDLYYHFSLQDYANLTNTELITLNYFTQNIVGLRVGFKLVSGGAEYENYKSNIMPFHRIRVYINLQKTINDKLTFLINGNFTNYTMLNDSISRIQNYLDLTGKVSYNILRQTRVDLDVMYRKQQGRAIDLDLLTARLELTSVVYQLYFTAGVEVYRRTYIGDRLNFKGTYIRISRRF